MPILDASELLTDPDFCQTITITRTTQTVSDQGEAQNDQFGMLVTAVCVPIRSAELQRLPDAERLAGGVTVYSQTPLFAGDGAIGADILTVNERQFTVVSIEDWTPFGAGFTVARCALLPLQND